MRYSESACTALSRDKGARTNPISGWSRETHAQANRAGAVPEPLEATGRAGTVTPTVHVKAGTLVASATASAAAPTVTVIGPFALVYAVPEPHPHLPAKHDDPIMLGTELGLVVVFVLAGWKLVACRLLRTWHV